MPMQFSVAYMGTFPKSVVGCNVLSLMNLNRMLGMWNPLRHSRVGCHELGWTHFHVAVLIPNSTYYLEIYIILPLTQWGGGGLRLLPTWHTWHSLRGIDQCSLKRLLEIPTSNKWQNKNPPCTSPNWRIIWHKHKAQDEATFIWSVTCKVVVINGRHGWISPIVAHRLWS